MTNVKVKLKSRRRCRKCQKVKPLYDGGYCTDCNHSNMIGWGCLQ